MGPKPRQKRKRPASDEEEKAASSSSSSDSGPEDRNPAPKSGTSGVKSADGETTWMLDKNRALKVSNWKGKTYIHIREYYEKDGKQLPGKKGISLTTGQWEKLKSFVAEVDQALAEV